MNNTHCSECTCCAASETKPEYFGGTGEGICMNCLMDSFSCSGRVSYCKNCPDLIEQKEQING